MWEDKREMDKSELPPEGAGYFNTRHANYLKDGAVYDGTHCPRVLPPLGVCGAGLRWSSTRQSTVLRRKFPRKGGDAALHIPRWGGKVIVLVPGQCSTKATHLKYSIYRFQTRIAVLGRAGVSVIFRFVS